MTPTGTPFSKIIWKAAELTKISEYEGRYISHTIAIGNTITMILHTTSKNNACIFIGH